MIIEAERVHNGTKVGVAIDPFNILCELSQDWRTSIGVQCDSPLMGGYWMKSEDSEHGPYTRIRLASREEIVRFEAFKEITAYTATLFS